MQGSKKKYQNSAAFGQKKSNFFQKPRNTHQSSETKPEPKSTRAAEETGNEFFIKPSTNIPKQSQNNNISNTTKRPFDKKQWRLQKYSKKYKLDQWENRRKKVVLREYYQHIDPNEKKLDVQKIYDQYDEESNTTEENDNDNNVNADNSSCQSTIAQSSSESNYDNEQSMRPNKKMGGRKNAFQKARDELARINEEKRLNKEDLLKRKQEKEEKLKLYRQKKAEKFKKLNKKTKKGQPIMKDRMEMLLEQIQNNM